MFKKGDKVICIDSMGAMTERDRQFSVWKQSSFIPIEGKTYEIDEVIGGSSYYIRLVGDKVFQWKATRFVKSIKEIRKEKLNKINEEYR
jgi:hypothetical protein